MFDKKYAKEQVKDCLTEDLKEILIKRDTSTYVPQYFELVRQELKSRGIDPDEVIRKAQVKIGIDKSKIKKQNANVKLLFKTNDIIEAELIKGKLELEGISAMIKGESLGGAYRLTTDGFGLIYTYVLEEQFEEAVSILETIKISIKEKEKEKVKPKSFPVREEKADTINISNKAIWIINIVIIICLAVIYFVFLKK